MASDTRWGQVRASLYVALATLRMGAVAAPVADGVAVPQDYLLTARHSDAFDTLENELTVEGWFLFHAPPPVDTRWMLVGKLGSYSISLARGVWVPENIIGITYNVREVRQDDAWLSASTAQAFHMDNLPLGEWVHLALQVSKDGAISAYFDGERLLGPAQLLRPMGRFGTPLYLGSVQSQRVGNPGFVAPDRDGTWTALDGRMDNVRLSSTFRYA